MHLHLSLFRFPTYIIRRFFVFFNPNVFIRYIENQYYFCMRFFHTVIPALLGIPENALLCATRFVTFSFYMMSDAPAHHQGQIMMHVCKPNRLFACNVAQASGIARLCCDSPLPAIQE